MPQRIDLDAQLAESRRPIDANWSAKKKMTVGAICGGAAIAALSGGVWAMVASRPPSLPRTPQEAVAVLSSDKWDNLSQDRRAQYMDEARRLVREMSEEERRKLMEDEKARQAFQQMREEMFDEMARRFARGEEMPWQRQRPEGERPQPSQEQMRQWRERQEQMTDEERAQMRERMRDMMNARVDQQLAGGNPQSGALRGEMMKRGGAGRGPGGGGGPRRGG